MNMLTAYKGLLWYVKVKTLSVIPLLLNLKYPNLKFRLLIANFDVYYSHIIWGITFVNPSVSAYMIIKPANNNIIIFKLLAPGNLFRAPANDEGKRGKNRDRDNTRFFLYIDLIILRTFPLPPNCINFRLKNYRLEMISGQRTDRSARTY